MQNIDSNKARLDGDEVSLIVEGLEAGQREYARMAGDALRLGYSTQSREFATKAAAFASLAGTARTVRIDRITVRHSA